MSALLPLGTLLPATGLQTPSTLQKIGQGAWDAIGPGTDFSLAGTAARAAGLGLGIDLGPNALARVVTGLLGLLLIAAAIFTHPTVINVGKKAAKAAGEAAAVA